MSAKNLCLFALLFFLLVELIFFFSASNAFVPYSHKDNQIISELYWPMGSLKQKDRFTNNTWVSFEKKLQKTTDNPDKLNNPALVNAEIQSWKTVCLALNNYENIYTVLSSQQKEELLKPQAVPIDSRAPGALGTASEVEISCIYALRGVALKKYSPEELEKDAKNAEANQKLSENYQHLLSKDNPHFRIAFLRLAASLQKLTVSHFSLSSKEARSILTLIAGLKGNMEKLDSLLIIAEKSVPLENTEKVLNWEAFASPTNLLELKSLLENRPAVEVEKRHFSTKGGLN